MNSKFFRRLLLASLTAYCVSARRIEKREAPEGKLYVYSDREGCVPVDSKEPCPVNWNLPPVFAGGYQGHNNIVNATIHLMSSSIPVDDKCKEAIKAVLCSQGTPRCRNNTTEIDYGNVTTELCPKVKLSCPREIIGPVCESSKSGKVKLKSECVSPPKLIEGICPQPKYKMPMYMLEEYKKSSKQLATMFSSFPDSNPIYSKDCLTKMKDMVCVQVACSEDEKRYLMKHDQDDCYDVMKMCFRNTKTSYPALDTLINNMKELLGAYCKMYPHPNATQTESAPPELVPPTEPATTSAPPSQPYTGSGLKTFAVLRVHSSRPNATKAPTSQANSHSPQKVFVLLCVLFKVLI